MRLIDGYSAVLLDMNGTFMFEGDRFGPGEDYYATYLALGGRHLDRQTLTGIVTDALSGLMHEYEKPDCYVNFPSVGQALRRYSTAPEREIALLEQLFARHEIGRVPADHVEFLHSLARTHVLGIVSNLFASPEPWLRLLEDMGLLPIFRTIVISSNERAVKPSHVLFQRALNDLPKDAKVLFVGDSISRDILPAKALGLDTVWIAPHGSAHPAADAVIPRLPDLAVLPAKATSTRLRGV